ncbi:MAG TPA: hypothetical protein VGO00_02295, partial [Kofleriaceae bacterium]|nr:hypothetical protein [Kofleriaceae bacterium]
MKLLPGSYTASITIANRTLTVDGFGATVTAPAAAETFGISGTSRVRMFGVAVVNGNTDSSVAGIRCQDPTVFPKLELDQV